jgi:hypothetical protein
MMVLKTVVMLSGKVLKPLVNGLVIKLKMLVTW